MGMFMLLLLRGVSFVLSLLLRLLAASAFLVLLLVGAS